MKDNWQTYAHVYMESNLYGASRTIQSNTIPIHLVYQCSNCGIYQHSKPEIKKHLIEKHKAPKDWLEGLNRMPYKNVPAWKENGSFYKGSQDQKIWLCAENFELL
jgi:hypothetical protein